MISQSPEQIVAMIRQMEKDAEAKAAAYQAEEPAVEDAVPMDDFLKMQHRGPDF